MMCWQILTLLYSLITCHHVAKLVEAKLCPLAEEGQPFHLECLCSSKSECESGINWTPSKFPYNVCYCSQPPKCICTDRNLSASLTDTGTGYQSVLTINTPSRDKLWGNWTCSSTVNTLFTCEFTVIAKPKNVTCTVQRATPANARDVIVTCEADDIYPSVECQVYQRTNSSVEENITADTSTGDKQCNLTISGNSLGMGQITFGVYMYPHGSNISYAVKSGDTASITIGYPSAIITDCPVNQNYILEGTIATCKCSRTDNTYFPVTVTMSSNTRESATGQESVLFSFTAKRNQVLTCTVDNSLGRSRTVTYTPQIAFLSKVLSFQVFPNVSLGPIQENMLVTFTCSAEGNPSPTLYLQKRGTAENIATSMGYSLQYNKTMMCRDTGVYLCKAEGLLDQANNSLEISVPCPQWLAKLEEQDKVYNGYVSETFSISLSVYGYPAPTSFSLSPAARAIPREAYIIGYLNQEPPYGVVVLQFNRLDESYFQNYTLYVTSTQGSLVYKFTIRKMTTTAEDVNVGAIVGGVVAGLLVIVLIVLIIIFVKRRGLVNKDQGQRDTPMTMKSLQEEEDKELPYENVSQDPQYEEIPSDAVTTQDLSRQPYRNILVIPENSNRDSNQRLASAYIDKSTFTYENSL